MFITEYPYTCLLIFFSGIVCTPTIVYPPMLDFIKTWSKTKVRKDVGFSKLDVIA